MRAFLIALAGLAAASCATGNPISPEEARERTRRDVEEERQQDRVRDLQDDFNRGYPDA